MIIRFLLCGVMALGIAFFDAYASGPRSPAQREQCFIPGEFPVSDWSIRGLSVGSANLDDVKSTLGHAPLFRLGSDAMSRRALCYLDGKNALVIFEASSMGGAAGLLTGITVEVPSNKRFEKNCVRPKKSPSRLLGAGRELKRTRASFEEQVSMQPCFRSDEQSEWKFENVSGEWSILSGLKARFFEDRVIQWKVFLVESS